MIVTGSLRIDPGVPYSHGEIPGGITKKLTTTLRFTPWNITQIVTPLFPDDAPEFLAFKLRELADKIDRECLKAGR